MGHLPRRPRPRAPVRVYSPRDDTRLTYPIRRLSLAVSFITFLTTIWGEGVVFTWLINLTGISSLLVWGTIGAISLRFRAAWAAQGCALDDLPYRQPLFPVLPVVTLVLAIAMFVAQGYASAVQDPFDAKVR